MSMHVNRRDAEQVDETTARKSEETSSSDASDDTSNNASGNTFAGKPQVQVSDEVIIIVAPRNNDLLLTFVISCQDRSRNIDNPHCSTAPECSTNLSVIFHTPN
jgi:hypothetical protein